jgi:type IV secretory pathway ATPase VirB11/archaellum biosynthesis ATPase
MNAYVTLESVKRQAKAIARGTSASHSQALDMLSVQAGYSHWGAYQEAIAEGERLAAERLARTISPYELVRDMLPDIGWMPQSVENARHLVISGGTGTGKTTALGRLLTFAPKRVPIALLEETPELTNPNPIEGLVLNVAKLRELGSPAYEIMRRAAIRNGAGILVYGEISTGNAEDFAAAVADPEGPTVLSTIHASSPDDAVRALRDRLRSRRLPFDLPSVAILQMRRDLSGHRSISELVTLQ